MSLESQFFLDAKTFTKRELMSKYHPDRYQDLALKQEAERLFKTISDEKPSHTYKSTRSYSYCSTPTTGWWTAGVTFSLRLGKQVTLLLTPTLTIG
jgi:hypothetical protein